MVESQVRSKSNLVTTKLNGSVLFCESLTKSSVIPFKMSNRFISSKMSAVIEVKSSYDCSAKSSQQQSSKTARQ